LKEFKRFYQEISSDGGKGEKIMNCLVLEPSKQITNIYKKIFDEKNYDAYFTKNESECMEKFYESVRADNASRYDFVIFENSCRLLDGSKLEDRIREIHPDQKIFFLSKYMNLDKSELSKKTQEIIEKPFAMITLLGYIEIVWPREIIVPSETS
jgi:DNA-binding NtrC family response regulator